MPLRFPDFPQPNEDFFVDPNYDELQALEQQQFVPGQYRRSPLEVFAGLENQDFRRPQSFGEGFLQGLSGGIGSLGTQGAQKRAQFEESEARRKAAFDANRIKRSQELRDMSGKERRDWIEAKRRDERELEKFNRENPALTDKDLADNPWLGEAGYGVGSRPPERIRAIIAESRAPENPKQKADRLRQEKRDEILIANAKRAADAAERSDNTARLNAYDKMQANYAAEPAVKAYMGIRSNLTTAESAAKQNSGPGDIALIYSWHRALEPDKPNVVREGDVALTREAVSALQKVYAVPGRFFSGRQLTTEGREYFLNQMRAALKAREADYKATNEQYTRTMQRFGVDPGQVIRDLSPGADVKAKGMQAVEPD